ncbi:hypothetical protein CISIN_1g040713mg [Citrus sinensis]|uniref:NB-ARC domain-containing protein n=1 Tax=Citrus sinensis TaxID=2711 RepID=A0A067DVF5_CITSI|nr:hypothetical protein CISIN_1g040713mg [Citrus sinensis]
MPCAKLTRLEIYDCKRLEALPKGLHNLTSLQELKIGGELPSLEEDGLPTNLHSLWIDGNKKIWKSMIERGRGFHRFSSLRHLTISGCDDDMVSFPPELKYFPEKGLPSSLLQLWIWGCPLIAEKCRKDGGQYWDLLTHIPSVSIANIWDFDDSTADD